MVKTCIIILPIPISKIATLTPTYTPYLEILQVHALMKHCNNLSFNMTGLEFFLISLLLTFLLCFSCCTNAQQPYVGKSTTACNNFDPDNSDLGYSCNGLNATCHSYLIYRALPPYNSVSSIAALLSSDPFKIAAANSVSRTSTFDANTVVIVPVNCSCSGQYYQANTSYTVVSGDNYFVIANNTFQGLTTCQALQRQSNTSARNLYTGSRIRVPLRCACPTMNQTDEGTNYLLSYIVAKGDFVSSIAVRFGADTGTTLQANGLSEESATIFPFTTLLVPLQNPPTVSQTTSPPPPPAPAPPPPPSPPGKSSSKTWVFALVGVLGGLVLILGLVLAVFCVYFLPKIDKKSDPAISSDNFEAAAAKPLKAKDLGDESEDRSLDFLDSLSSTIAQSIKVYGFEVLRSATDNFNPSCLIGGSVYRGTLNGDLAAIKKVEGDVSKEISLLNKINHFNLIRLSGVCFNEGHWYLGYEYAANGSLSQWIYLNNRRAGNRSLTWIQRVEIALDVATGLNYLHSFTDPPHVHKDIKSSNVLLDHDLRAKIANFGLARSTQGTEGQFALTRHIVGTKGYMAPEYLENGLVSTMLDVYAFGVLVLEMITGKEAAELLDERLLEVLSGMVREEDDLRERRLKQLMDPSLEDYYPKELAVVLLRLVDSCLKKDPVDRPAMDEAVSSLSRIYKASLASVSSHGS